MKIQIKCLSIVSTLIASLGLMLTNPAKAQTFTTLHSFTNSPDGTGPEGNLALSGGTLYGAASGGGTNGSGTVFSISTSGSNYTNLYSFSGSDGASPSTGVIVTGGTVYGTTFGGGTTGDGTVFAVSTNGSNFMTLHNFSALLPGPDGFYVNSDGASPLNEGLISSVNTLFGTAGMGGTNGSGTVFSFNTITTNFDTLYNFTLLDPVYYTNSDGSDPESSLLLSGNVLYGTCNSGGSLGWGTVFSVSTNGTNYTVLHVFAAARGNSASVDTNSDGFGPTEAGLILSGNTLYGTASGGGTNGYGTIFSLNTSGTNFTVLHTFNYNDGDDPLAGLIMSGNTLFGTTWLGGTNGNGTVFSLNTDGLHFTVLHNFTALSGSGTNSDGAKPTGGLVLSGNTLYGTAQYGGSAGDGTVFSLTVTLSVTPQLAITLLGTNVILNWPTNAAGFTLESATNLTPQAIWVTNAPPPVVVGTNNAVTNGIFGTRKFYRLISQ
jgi:uncharacterized repeat protein (TIGR03803 family)